MKSLMRFFAKRYYVGVMTLEVYESRFNSPPLRTDWQGCIGPFDTRADAENYVAAYRINEEARAELAKIDAWLQKLLCRRTEQAQPEVSRDLGAARNAGCGLGIGVERKPAFPDEQQK